MKDIKIILKDLYLLDPEFKNHEEELMRIIKDILESKPDTKFDKKFAKELRAQILGGESHQPYKDGVLENITNTFKHMTNIYKYAGAFAILAVVVVSASYYNNQSQSYFAFSPEINKVGEGAFGSLLSQDGKGSAERSTSDLENAIEDTAFQSDGNIDNSAVGLEKVSSLITVPAAGFGGGGVASEDAAIGKMIAPYPYTQYKYVYAGEEVALEDDTISVLKRIKGTASGSAIANQVKNLNLGILNLSSFDSAQMQNISFAENKDFGYRVEINFSDASVSIYENWEKWKNLSTICGNDSKCYEDSKLKITDVPTDSELISIANGFLSDRGINTDFYSDPVVDNNWRRNYDLAVVKENAWVPEQVQVKYPLLINNEEVYDQGGNSTGLVVNINIRHKRAGGVWGLRTNQFESSEYDAVTNFEDIKKIVEAGGLGYYIEPRDGTEEKTLELGTPERILTQQWTYSEGQSSELFVPALKFPILNPPTEEYFWRKNIIIPLAKELIEKQLPTARPLPVDDVIIMQKEVPGEPEGASIEE
jgi:hypothetical protein